jgi:hypothetical protein
MKRVWVLLIYTLLTIQTENVLSREDIPLPSTSIIVDNTKNSSVSKKFAKLISTSKIKEKVMEIYQRKEIDTSKLLENEPKYIDEQELYYKKILEQLSLIYPDTNSSSTVVLEKKE